MSIYPTWNDYFSRKHDNAVQSTARKSASASLDDFENRYRKKYGVWIDHHHLKLIKLYGPEKAHELILQNIEMMYADERQAAAQKRKQYDFHPVPSGVEIPF